MKVGAPAFLEDIVKTMSQFVHLEAFSYILSSSSLVIRVNLLHPCPFCFLYYFSINSRFPSV